MASMPETTDLHPSVGLRQCTPSPPYHAYQRRAGHRLRRECCSLHWVWHRDKQRPTQAVRWRSSGNARALPTPPSAQREERGHNSKKCLLEVVHPEMIRFYVRYPGPARGSSYSSYAIEVALGQQFGDSCGVELLCVYRLSCAYFLGHLQGDQPPA
jgi:hypothetical protein